MEVRLGGGLEAMRTKPWTFFFGFFGSRAEKAQNMLSGVFELSSASEFDLGVILGPK